MMKFYIFDQNNSGGNLIVNDYLDAYVIIQAKNATQANKRAKTLEIYFNGVEKGIDCEMCCGDRWEQVLEGQGFEKLSNLDLHDYVVYPNILFED